MRVRLTWAGNRKGDASYVVGTPVVHVQALAERHEAELRRPEVQIVRQRGWRAPVPISVSTGKDDRETRYFTPPGGLRFPYTVLVHVRRESTTPWLATAQLLVVPRWCTSISALLAGVVAALVGVWIWILLKLPPTPMAQVWEWMKPTALGALVATTLGAFRIGKLPWFGLAHDPRVGFTVAAGLLMAAWVGPPALVAEVENSTGSELQLLVSPLGPRIDLPPGQAQLLLVPGSEEGRLAAVTAMLLPQSTAAGSEYCAARESGSEKESCAFASTSSERSALASWLFRFDRVRVGCVDTRVVVGSIAARVARGEKCKQVDNATVTFPERKLREQLLAPQSSVSAGPPAKLVEASAESETRAVVLDARLARTKFAELKAHPLLFVKDRAERAERWGVHFEGTGVVRSLEVLLAGGEETLLSPVPEGQPFRVAFQQGGADRTPVGWLYCGVSSVAGVHAIDLLSVSGARLSTLRQQLGDSTISEWVNSVPDRVGGAALCSPTPAELSSARADKAKFPTRSLEMWLGTGFFPYREWYVDMPFAPNDVVVFMGAERQGTLSCKTDSESARDVKSVRIHPLIVQGAPNPVRRLVLSDASETEYSEWTRASEASARFADWAWECEPTQESALNPRRAGVELSSRKGLVKAAYKGLTVEYERPKGRECRAERGNHPHELTADQYQEYDCPSAPKDWEYRLYWEGRGCEPSALKACKRKAH
jgi:hypothetical protein